MNLMVDEDKRLVLTLNSGEKVALPQGNPLKNGDRVLVIPTNNGEFATTGNNPIRPGDNVVVLTTNQGEKVSVNVFETPPGPPTPTGLIDCIGGDTVYVYLANPIVGQPSIGGQTFGIPVVLPPCCMVNVSLSQIVRVFSYPDPDYDSPWGLFIPPYKYNHVCQNVTNMAPQIGYVGPWNIFVMYARMGEFNVLYNNETPTNITLGGGFASYDYLNCPSDIPGSQNVCWVDNLQPINSLVYGQFADFLTSRGGSDSLYRDINSNPELKDGGNTITIEEVDSGYCDTTKVQIELRISRKEYLENPSKYQLIG